MTDKATPAPGKALAAKGGRASGTWTAVTAAAVYVCGILEGKEADELLSGHLTTSALIGVAFGLVRAVLAAVQGNVGKPDTASWDKSDS